MVKLSLQIRWFGIPGMFIGGNCKLELTGKYGEGNIEGKLYCGVGVLRFIGVLLYGKSVKDVFRGSDISVSKKR